MCDRATSARIATLIRRLAPALAALALIAAWPQPAIASFTAENISATSGAGTDHLDRHFAIVPGAATQPGTATPAATGAGRTLAIDLGRVPDTRTIADVVRVTNVTAAALPLDLSLLGTLAGVAGFEYADGTTVKTIAAGATQQIQVRTSAAAAGVFTGGARFQQGADTFLRIDGPLVTRQAPLAATGLAAAPPTGTAQVQLSWTASPSSGVAGYNVYRATAAGGPYAKVNASPVAATVYADTSVTIGGNYWYRVRAVAAGVSPDLESPDSATVQTSVMPSPVSVRIPASASNALDWVSRATRTNVTFEVAVPAGTAAGDVVGLTVTSGANTLTRTAMAAGGAQTIAFTGNNLNTWADGAMGSIAMSARLSRGALSAPPTTGSAGKDTVVPAAPTGARVIAGTRNPVDYVNSYTASAALVLVNSGAVSTESVEARLTSGTVTATGIAAGPGNVNVTVNASALPDTAVGALAVAARVVDLAGNASAWFSGTAATKDTVAPALPNVARIAFTNLWFGRDMLRGNSNALSANAQVRAIDYSNNTWYPTGGTGWQNGTGTGGFNPFNVANGGTPRTLGFESRDAAWNVTARACGRYTASGTGTSVACP